MEPITLTYQDDTLTNWATRPRIKTSFKYSNARMKKTKNCTTFLQISLQSRPYLNLWLENNYYRHHFEIICIWIFSFKVTKTFAFSCSTLLIFYWNITFSFMRSLFLFRKPFSLKLQNILPWLVWLSGFSDGLQIKGLLVWFPVTVHAWVAGQVPSRGHARGNHTLMFLSLSFSLPSPLSKNT